MYYELVRNLLTFKYPLLGPTNWKVAPRTYYLIVKNFKLIVVVMRDVDLFRFADTYDYAFLNASPIHYHKTF